MHKSVVAAVRAAGIQFVTFPGWEFGEAASIAEYSRIFSVSSDRAALAKQIASAYGQMRDALSQVEPLV